MNLHYAKRLGHPEGHYIVASSAIQNILSLYYDTGEISHVARPGGLVGGYPVRLSQDGIKLALPREISQEEAIRISQESSPLSPASRNSLPEDFLERGKKTPEPG